jgi:hypothetical protein
MKSAFLFATVIGLIAMSLSTAADVDHVSQGE